MDAIYEIDILVSSFMFGPRGAQRKNSTQICQKEGFRVWALLESHIAPFDSHQCS